MSYGRQRLDEIQQQTSEGAFDAGFLESLLSKPVVPLVTSDFEKLLQKETSVTKLLTKLERREIIKSVLMEHRIIVPMKETLVINPTNTTMNRVLNIILKDVGGRLNCPLCNSQHPISCPNCRWVVEFF